MQEEPARGLDVTRLPQGTVTLLMTDIEGSVRQWESEPAAMALAQRRHEVILTEAIEANGGLVLKTKGEGDSIFAVFTRAFAALAAGRDLQIALASESWPAGIQIRVRVAIHSGELWPQQADYYGPAVNRCARLRSAAHGGQVLVSETTFALAHQSLPDGVGLLPLGEHQLRDLSRPERIYQLVHPALALEFPPIRSLDLWRHSLPTQLTAFIGREQQLAEVRRLVCDRRLVTVAGPAGCGKTRLALQVAAELLGEFTDGAWFVPLAPVERAAFVADAVAKALQLRQDPGRTVEALVAGHLADRHLLLILDNCEHLTEPVRHLATTLLRGAPRLHILATSRERLHSRGEVVHLLPPLTHPPVGAVVAGNPVTDYEAVRLFLDRAIDVEPGFALSADKLDAVLDLCARLDGLPLSIELAAAQLRYVTLPQLLGRLDQVLTLPIDGMGSDEKPCGSLEAMIDWSYGLLAASEQRLFELLSSFAGSFSLEAAEYVASGGTFRPGQVLGVLEGLVDKSMITTATDTELGSRFALLHTLRAYGRHKLAARGDSSAAMSRQLSYYTHLAKRCNRELAGERPGPWFAELEADLDNLRAVLDWAVIADPDRGLCLAAALWRFWRGHGRCAEGRAYLERLLNQSTSNCTHRARLDGLVSAGLLAYRQGAISAARRFFDEALVLAERSDDVVLIAECLNEVAIVAAESGDALSAHELFNKAVLILGGAHPKSRAYIRRNQAWLLSRQGHLDQARQCLVEVMEFVSAHGPAELAVDVSMDMAAVAVAREGVAEARNLVSETLQQCEKAQRSDCILEARLWLGYLDRVAGRFEEARACLERCLERARELSDSSVAFEVLSEMAQVAYALGDNARAEELNEEAIAMLPEAGGEFQRAKAIALRGRIAAARGDSSTARQSCAESLSIFTAIGCQAETARLHCDRALLLAASGDLRAAWGELAEGLRDASCSGDRRKTVLALETATQLLVVTGRPAQAVRLAAAADAQRRRMGMPAAPVVRKQLGDVLRSARRALGTAAPGIAAGGRKLAIERAADELAELLAAVSAEYAGTADQPAGQPPEARD